MKGGGWLVVVFVQVCRPFKERSHPLPPLSCAQSPPIKRGLILGLSFCALYTDVKILCEGTHLVSPSTRPGYVVIGMWSNGNTHAR